MLSMASERLSLTPIVLLLTMYNTESQSLEKSYTDESMTRVRAVLLKD